MSLQVSLAAVGFLDAIISQHHVSSLALIPLAAIVLLLILFRIWVGRRVAADVRRNRPASPLQILERRLAQGEISADEYRYERQLLEKDQ